MFIDWLLYDLVTSYSLLKSDDSDCIIISNHPVDKWPTTVWITYFIFFLMASLALFADYLTSADYIRWKMSYFLMI